MEKEKKTFSDDWVKEKKNLLKQELPPNFLNKLFTPDNDFYASYKELCKTDSQKALEEMTNKIFSYLQIERRGCLVGFYRPEEIVELDSPDTAGFYTKGVNKEGQEVEIIMINANYHTAAIGVAAILAHEIMHLLLFRHNIKLEDRLENEVLTDLATIETGLGILTINAMSVFSNLFLTLIFAAFGFLYWSSGEIGYGYLGAKQYAKYFREYIGELKIPSEQIGGRIAPLSRSLVKLSSFKKYSDTTDYIEFLRKDHIKLTLKKLAFLAIILVICFYFQK